MIISKTAILAAVILIIISIFGFYVQAANEKKIIYFTGCKNNEVVSDIEYSIQGIAYYAEKNNILIKKINRKKCGYVLIFDAKQKILKSALTDVDLIDECRKFYHTK
jgi:hypothetical protein